MKTPGSRPTKGKLPYGNTLFSKKAYYFYISLVIIVAIMIPLTLFLVDRNNDKRAPSNTPNNQSNAHNQTTGQKTVDHIFVIMEENKTYSEIIDSNQAPYLNSLAQKYSLANNYFAITHPSLPNYIALTSGSTNGITTDCNPPSAGCEVDVNNIGDELEKAGKTWKMYAEGMPSNCYSFNSGEYATKHNPFIYYSDIINNKPRCNNHVVPFSQMNTDLDSATTTPNFAFISPDLCNDMHDCTIATGDGWLSKYASVILESKAFTSQNSLLIITWDEGTADNHIATILAGPAAKAGYRSATYYDHYSLLHTIESNWKLDTMTNNDASAAIMNDLLK